MEASLSMVFYRAVSILDIEFEIYVVLKCLKNSMMKVSDSILLYFLYLIRMVGRIGIGELTSMNII